MADAFRFSRRTGWPAETNALARLIERKKAEGRAVLDLTVSNPTACGLRSLDARFLTPLADPANLRYDPDPRGLAEARDAVAAYYAERGARVDPGNVFIAASTSEAYGWAFRLAADSGDAVAVPTPSYPLFDDLLRLEDLQPARYALRYDGRWSVDAASLAVCAARAVVAVNPNNPTGHYVSGADREALNRFARDRGACLISDEVFLDYSFDGAPRGALSLAANRDALTFTLGGLSKAAALPQMKLAWVVLSGPAAECAEAARRLEHLADTALSAATPPQRALGAWLALSGEVRAEIAARVRENLASLERGAAAAGAAPLHGEGGWSAVLRIGADDEATALALLEHDDVLVHPGYLFDFKGDHLVVSLLAEPRVFSRAAERIWTRLKKSP